MTPLVLTALALAAPAPRDAAPSGPLDGVWVYKGRESFGKPQPLPESLTRSYTLILVGSEFHFRDSFGPVAVDPEAGTIDLNPTLGRYTGATLGRYERTGGVLRVAMPLLGRKEPRPAELATNADTGHLLYTFERDTTVTPAQAASLLKELREKRKAYEATRRPDDE